MVTKGLLQSFRHHCHLNDNYVLGTLFRIYVRDQQYLTTESFNYKVITVSTMWPSQERPGQIG